MAEINLSKYGITGTTEIVHNPSYEELFKEEMKPELKGYEKGQETELGAVNVMTGIYTGRSPKDKFIVEDENSKNTVWWTSDEYDFVYSQQELAIMLEDIKCARELGVDGFALSSRIRTFGCLSSALAIQSLCL